MAIRVPSRTKLLKYGHVEVGIGGPTCPTLIEPEAGAFMLQEEVTFLWSSVNGATSYNIYIWEEGDAEPQPINTTSLTYSTTLEFGSTYRWRVTAVNDFGESSGCTYGQAFPSLPPGKSGYQDFEVTEGYVNLEDDLYIVEDVEPSVTINIIRTGSSGPATTEYDTADGTAVAPTNYTATSGTASWASGVDGAFPVAIPIEPLPLVEELSAEYLPDWEDGTDDPRLVDRTYEYRSGETAYSTLAEAVAAAEATLGYTLTKLPLWRRRRQSEGPSEPSPLEYVDPEEDEWLNFQYTESVAGGYLSPSLMYSEADYNSAVSMTSPPDDDYEPFTGLFNLGVPLNTYFYVNLYSGSVAYINSDGDARPQPAPTTGQRGWGAGNNCIDGGGFFCPYNPSSSVAQILLRGMTDIGIRRTVGTPPVIGSEFPDWEICPDKFWYDSETDTLYSKAQWEQVNGSYRWLSKYVVSGGGVSTVQRKPLSPCLEVGDPNDTEAFWTAAYNAAVAAGDLPSGMTYDATGTASGVLTYPRNSTYAYYRSYKIPLSFTFGISNAIGATIREPDTATVWIVNDC